MVRFFRAPARTAVADWNDAGVLADHLFECGNFDAEEAILEWESMASGMTVEELLANNIPEISWEGESGSFIMEIPIATSSWLLRASEGDIGELASFWSRNTERYGQKISQENAISIIREVGRLVAEARRDGEAVYCWTSGL
jgi:hypothetical protein